MKTLKLSNNFYLHEYIPEDLYRKHEAKGELWKLQLLIDDRLVHADQKLRDKFGPAKINDWYWDGDRNWSGLRTPESPYYSMFSQHSWGRASDSIYENATPEEVRQEIIKNPKKYGITRLEGGVNWVHKDIGYHNNGNLWVFNP